MKPFQSQSLGEGRSLGEVNALAGSKAGQSWSLGKVKAFEKLKALQSWSLGKIEATYVIFSNNMIVLQRYIQGVPKKMSLSTTISGTKRHFF